MFVWNSESSIWNFDIKFDRERKLATEIKRRKKQNRHREKYRRNWNNNILRGCTDCTNESIRNTTMSENVEWKTEICIDIETKNKDNINVDK